MKNVKSQYLSPNVQKLLIDLENNLGSVVRKSASQQSSAGPVETDFSGGFVKLLILTLPQKFTDFNSDDRVVRASALGAVDSTPIQFRFELNSMILQMVFIASLLDAQQ